MPLPDDSAPPVRETRDDMTPARATPAAEASASREGGWRSVESGVLVAMLSSFFVVAALCAASLHTATRSLETEHALAHGQEVVRTLESFRAEMYSTFASQRGYLLQGEPALRAARDQALAAAAGNLERLQALTRGRSAAEWTVGSLAELVSERRRHYQTLDAIAARHGLERAAAAFVMVSPQGVVGEVVNRSIAFEETRLARREADAREAVEQMYWAFAATAAVLALGLMALFRRIHRGLRLRRQAERALAEALGKLNRAISASHVVLWDADLRRRELSFSNGWAFAADLTPAPRLMPLERVREFIPAADFTRITEAARLAAGGTDPEFAVEHRVRGEGGDWRWVLARGRVTERDAATGRALRVSGTHVDITERKQAEERLQRFNEELERKVEERSGELRAAVAFAREREQFLRLVTENLPAMIAYYSSERVCRYANARYAAAFGLTPEQAAGRHLREIVGERLCDEIEARLAAARPAEIVRYERPLDREPGTLLEVALTPHFGADGGTDGYFVLILDVTERRRMEQRLRDDEERLATLVASALDGIVVIDDAQRIVSFNPAAEHIFGHRAEDVLGEPLERLLPERLREAHREHLKRYADTGASRRMGGTGRIFGLHADGSEFMLDASISRFGVGRQRYFSVILRDVTEQVRAGEEIRRLNAELEERVKSRTAELEAANRELESFSYSVSHDLRAPLRAILGYGRLLAEAEGMRLSNQGQRCLETINTSGERMAALIDGLLRLARFGRIAVQRAQIDMTALARRIAEEECGRHPAARARVAELPRANADGPLVEQVLANLIGNAFKYSAKTAAPEIEIGAFARDGETVYFVRDNGAGFDPRYAAKLFEPFGRLHGAQEFEGSGIGLAIVRRIVERHGGRVWAESEPGEGATFCFTLGRNGSR